MLFSYIMGKNHVIPMPLMDMIKIYILAYFEGFVCVLCLILNKLWKGSKQERIREKPPSCLTNTSLGNHSYIKIKGVKLHYVESGNKESPPLILLHGFPDSWITWRHQIPVLSKYFRVIAVDLKGMGESDKPQRTSSYKISRLQSELGSLVEAVTDERYPRATIVAHGLGGVLVWYYLASSSAQEKVEKFVSIAAPHPNHYWKQSSSNGIINPKWIGLCQLPMLAELKCLSNDMAFINNCHGQLSETDPEDKQILDAYKYLFSRPEDWKGALNYFRTVPFWRLQTPDTVTSKRISPQQKRRSSYLRVPTLLIAGNGDPSISLESVIASTDYLDSPTLKVVPAISHFPHQENPSEVNSILVDFLVDYIDSYLKIGEPVDGAGSLVSRMFGAVSSTVNTLQKRTNDFKSRALSLRTSNG